MGGGGGGLCRGGGSLGELLQAERHSVLPDTWCFSSINDSCLFGFLK